MATSLPPSGAAGAGGSATGGGVSGSAATADAAASSTDIFPFPPEELVELDGTPRDDVLIGGASNEEITGFRGNDVLFGGAGDDRLDGGIGGDRLEGGPGWDSYDGGPGRDTISFHTAQTSAFADLTTGSVMLGDTFEFAQEIENLTGSDFGDTLLGNDYDNVLAGASGLDLLGGGLGDDTLDGGADGAYATWAGQDGAVEVDLAAGRATEWDGGTDVLIDILGAVGTDHDDILLGNAQANRLEGGLGDDRLDGRAGDDVLVGGPGADVLIGGSGLDLADYSGGDAVRVNLLAGEAIEETGGGGSDTLSGIENVLGSLGRDTLVGDDRANRLEGSVGRDTLRGNGGDDTFVFSDRLDFGDTIEDFRQGDHIELARLAVGDGSVTFDAGSDRLLLDPGGDAESLVIATVLGGNPSAADIVLV